VKADIKSKKFRRIRYLVFLPFFLPFQFLWSYIAVIWAFGLKPYPLALKEFGIRVVSLEDDGTWANHIKVYTALEMLNRHDREKLELVKKHFRIIFIVSKKYQDLFFNLGAGVCIVNLQRIFAERPPGQRLLTIIWGLVYEASHIKFAGKFGVYLHTSEAVKSLCKEESRRTMQKLKDALPE
jgi:hypothetical protein